jgi:hypothetical protein
MATIDGRPVDTKLFPIVTKAFRYDELTVPPMYEVKLLGAELKRKTIRYKVGQRVACKTWQDFKDLEAKARTHSGEVQFI